MTRLASAIVTIPVPRLMTMVNVKINGKDLKKIMVDGKEFFGGDVKTGLKNLPVDMIDRLKLMIRNRTWHVSQVLMTVKKKPCST